MTTAVETERTQEQNADPLDEREQSSARINKLLPKCSTDFLRGLADEISEHQGKTTDADAAALDLDDVRKRVPAAVERHEQQRRCIVTHQDKINDIQQAVIDAQGTIKTAATALANEDVAVVFDAARCMDLAAVCLQTVINDLQDFPSDTSNGSASMSVTAEPIADPHDGEVKTKLKNLPPELDAAMRRWFNRAFKILATLRAPEPLLNTAVERGIDNDGLYTTLEIVRQCIVMLESHLSDLDHAAQAHVLIAEQPAAE